VFVVHNRWKLDILKGAHPGREIEGLEYKSDLLPHEMRKFGFGEFANVLSLDVDISSGWEVEASDQVHERALA
jgi:hypothetical protein